MPTRRLRVAALIDTYEVFGAGRQLAPMGPALRDHGVTHRVLLFHRAGRERPPYASYLDALGADHVIVPEHGPADARVLKRTAAQLAAFDPDIVETHGYKPSTIVATLRAVAAPRWSWLAFFHGGTTENAKVRAYNWIDRRAMSRADRLAVMSLAHREAFAHLGDRVRVVYNAVAELPAPNGAPTLRVRELFCPTPAADEVVLGVIGRLSSEKGVDVFLDACRRLVDAGERFRAVIVGDGPDRMSLTARAAALGLDACVAFAGTLRDVAQVYRQLTCVVIPSRSEGLPNVLLEALDHDLPVVATRVGAVPEVLTDPLAGVIVPPVDPDALADGIRRAIALARTPGAASARASTVRLFSLDARVDAHLALYAELADTIGVPVVAGAA
ncbi:MAG TPA: glycosyltransferase family 4 protein [Gemmatirosa sp.]